MLLSDKLIEIGRKSNPKNNLSMANATNLMNSECKMALKNGDIPARVKNSFTLAVNELKKAGYPYYKPEHLNL